MSNKQKEVNNKNMKTDSSKTPWFYVPLVAAVCIFTYIWWINNSLRGDDWSELYYLVFSAEDGLKGYLHPNCIAPFTQFTLSMEYQLWGVNPQPYRIFHLLLHIAISIETFFLIKYIIGKSNVALLSSVLYAVCYLHVETVGWAVQVRYSLFVFFSMTSTLLFLYFPKNIPVKGLVCLLILLALGSKEQAVILPFIILLLSWRTKRGLNAKEVLLLMLPLILWIIFAKLIPANSSVLEGYRNSEAYRYSPIFSSLNFFRWNFLYGAVPFCFGDINHFTYLLAHSYAVLAAFVYYFLIKDVQTRKDIVTLFLCAALAYAPSSLGGTGIQARYAYFPEVFIAPITVLLLSEGLFTRSPFSRVGPLRCTVIVVTLLCISNFFTVQRILGVYRQAGEICRKDIQAAEAGNLKEYMYNTAIQTVPAIMSPKVHYMSPQDELRVCKQARKETKERTLNNTTSSSNEK